jgi:hypothetical protein
MTTAQMMTVCLLAISSIEVHHTVDLSDNLTVCLDVAEEAARQNVPVVLAVSVAREESGFTRSLTSPNGCCYGPVQVNMYWARRLGACHVLASCDTIAVGLGWLSWLISEHGVERALCHYNQGDECLLGGQRYARRVLIKAHRWSRWLDAAEHERQWRDPGGQGQD